MDRTHAAMGTMGDGYGTTRSARPAGGALAALRAAGLALGAGTVLLLSACGFELAARRPLPAPLGTVYIAMASPYRVEESPLQAALRRELMRRGGTVQTRAERGVPTIRLSDLREQRDTLSIGPDGKALEYRLSLSVRYALEQDGHALLGSDELTVRREYSFSVDQILAKEAEEAQLRAYIQTEMAELLLLKLEVALGAKAPDAAAPESSTAPATITAPVAPAPVPASPP